MRTPVLLLAGLRRLGEPGGEEEQAVVNFLAVLHEPS
jgi:hypothetical protein